MQLLVTGISGFVGSHVARAARAQGHAVRGLVRATSSRALIDGLDVELVTGDLGDAAALRRAAEGVDAVVHCAATTSETAPDETLSRQTNIDGTAHLLAACPPGLRRFVFISSQSANPGNTSVYGRTKLAAERVVEEAAVPWTILRPSTIYGSGARGLFAKMCRLIAALPVVPVIGDGTQCFRPIHVDDVAAAVLACLEAPAVVGRRYDLGGADAVRFADFLDGIGTLVGRRPRLLRLPIPACLLAARVLGRVLANPPLTVDNVVGVMQMQPCDISAAERDFGFRPLPLRDGLARCAGGAAARIEEAA